MGVLVLQALKPIQLMKRVLPVIVIAQFFCASPWFAVNSSIADIVRQFSIEPAYLAHLASAVQFGFIAGTLVFAIFAVSDRFSPSRVFFTCAMLNAVINLAICINGINIAELMLFRFLTGFFLAGIYPVGMKIAADYYRQGLGKSLGFLLGALVLGTAFPHLLKSISAALPWKYVIYSTSLLSVLGGVGVLLLVPDGPYHKRGQKLQLAAFVSGFRNKEFRAVALGYFGHMWELYTFWVFVPVMLNAWQHRYPATNLPVSFVSFIIIAAGCVSCFASGLVSQHWGAKKTAFTALSVSCACCLVSPLFLLNPSPVVLLLFLFTWSMAVIADSPMFSTLIAQNAPPASKGSSLTIVNCIGFAITIVSIQLLNSLLSETNARYIYILLAAGPIFGLIALLKNKEKQEQV